MSLEVNGNEKLPPRSRDTFEQLLTMASLSLLLVVVVLLATIITPSSASFIRQSDLPHDKWVSLDQDVEYLPILASQQERQLGGDDDTTFYNNSPYVEGESEYDEYQQAWRYLGTYRTFCMNIT